MQEISTIPQLNINLNNVKDNYQFLKSISFGAKTAAVVKDDAYGIGAREVVKLLSKEGCDTFFIAHATEAIDIRDIVPNATIYVLNGIGQGTIDIFKKYNLTPVISNPTALKFWNDSKIPNIKPAIQIDTGLNRLGFSLQQIKDISEEARSNFSLVMSHLSCGDAIGHFMNTHQLENFQKVLTYFPNIPASLSASDGAMLGKEFTFDMVRLGAALYGINTAPYRQNQVKSVVELKAPILQIKDLPIGEFVGYGASYRAHSESKIAIISIGYGDGIFRSLSNTGRVWIGDYEAKILGRVSMDMITIDVTNIPEDILISNNYATLLNDKYTLDNMANDAGTIGYEILSRIGKGQRYVKNYKQG